MLVTKTAVRTQLRGCCAKNEPMVEFKVLYFD